MDSRTEGRLILASLPAIVIIAYKREKSVERLLKSIESAHYCEEDIPLIISIDRSDNSNVQEIAERFQWRHGLKRIIVQSERLGLREHVFRCCNLANYYGSVILLEDDLYVSPYFYGYAKEASEFYEDDDKVAGVSLYSQYSNQVVALPFCPIDDGSDVYFLQIGSSLGQLFSGSKWASFMGWYSNHSDIRGMAGLPESVAAWPDSSWKKYFTAYLKDTGKYFVYPRISLTTSFSDEGGENVVKSTALHQVPILFGMKEWRFRRLSESLIKYDPYCEIQADYIKYNYPELSRYDFEVDLYGAKPLDKINRKFLITSKPTKRPIMGFGLGFKTIHANINPLVVGDYFVLAEKQDCYDTLISQVRRKIAFFNFFYRETSVRLYFLLMLKRILDRWS